MSKFIAAIAKGASGTVLRLTGSLVEGGFRILQPLGAKLPSAFVVDMSGVDQVNSCGIVEWIEWLDDLGPAREVFLQSCSPAVVNVFNLIPRFCGGHPVISVMVPYECRPCSVEFVVDIPTQVLKERTPEEFEQSACPSCRQAASARDYLSDYLIFLGD